MTKGMLTRKEAVKIVEGTIGDHPEVKVIQDKEGIIEAKYASVDGYHYCQECSTWTPEEPPEIMALSKEWDRIFNREVEKVWKTKSAA